MFESCENTTLSLKIVAQQSISVIAESCENTELKFVAQQFMSVVAESCEKTVLKLL